MFTGIVETIGTITDIVNKDGCNHLTIAPQKPFSDLAIGESIAVNGVCLTVTQFTETMFDVTAVPETLRLTNMDQLQIGSFVNLEQALKANDRLGGHYVQGHVDGMGQILSITPDDHAACLVKVSLPTSLAKYVIPKGYIGLDGMSLTIIQAMPTWFTFTLIPHTQQATIAHHYREGTWVNIEVDMMGKYIEKLLVGVHTHAN